jgi:hypothetical protein
MSRHSLTEHDVLEYVRPKTLRERRQLFFIIGFVLVLTVGAGTVVYLAQRSQNYREEHWNSAVATIEDTQTQLVAEMSGYAGGFMLCRVQVLAAYSVNGLPQKRWITVDQPPVDLDKANFQKRFWQGKQRIVRWNPSDPNRVVIELH